MYDYVTKGDQRMLQSPNKYYGPVFELSVLSLENLFGLRDSRDIYFMRHLFTFSTLLLGAFFFYKLCKYLFRSWKIGLLGALFLILSPRIFADSFYNPKDIPFLALFIVSMYTMFRYLDTKTIRWAVLHAVACAVLADIRIVGLLVPLFTVGFGTVDLARARRDKGAIRKSLLSGSVYVVLTGALIVLLWPTLWHRPLYNLIQAFREMGHYPYEMPVLYQGRYIPPPKLPWHYTLVWMGISTPIVYTVCFIAGCIVSVRLLFRGSLSFGITRRNLIALMLWFFFPLLYLKISKAVVFDAWRHTFFVYPAFLGICLIGLVAVFKALKARLPVPQSTALASILILAIALSLVNVARIMVRYHPYQNVYFNALTHGVRGAEGKFDLDYWGLSYRQALEYIVKNDPAEVIRVCSFSRPGEINAGILPVKDRQRLVFIDDANSAKYYVTDFRWGRVEFRPEEILYRVQVDGATVMTVINVVAHTGKQLGPQ